jgi:uncharacterized peroxidase-related enzyme
MAHINLKKDLYGIRGLLDFCPEIAKPLNQLAEILLRNEDNSLTRGERELIGTYVSHLNDCFFCQNVHGGIAQHYMSCDLDFIEKIKANFENSPISDKMKALLSIAASVQKGGKNVQFSQIENAKTHGATEKEIHDTVMISAFFCMCNRYVDGLGTSAIADRQYYVERGKMRAEEGYIDFDLNK